jgi:two-component system LytT family response regulator
VIFTTAYDQYALQAFGVNSVDYLLKPVEPRALERAISKVEALRGSGDASQPDLERLLQRIAASVREPPPQYPERIASRLGDRIWFLDLKDVSHFYAEHKLTYAVCDGKPYCVDHAISGLETRLDPHKFFRIHRGAVVNLAWIKEVTSLPGGMLNVRLRDAKSSELTVARDRVREFKERAGY